MLASPAFQPVLVAWMLWGLAGVLLTALAAAIPNRLPVGLPGLWALLGCVLTTPVHTALKWASGRGWLLGGSAVAASVSAAVVCQAAATGALVRLAVYSGSPGAAFAPAGALPLGHFSSAASVSVGMALGLWVFGCYAACVVLVGAERRIGRGLARFHEAETALLRHQLNPHFIFNATNALSTLILMRKNAEADEAVMALSAFLRSALTSDPRGYGRLGDEIAMTEQYFQIEAIRFPDRLHLACRAPAELLSAQVPSFFIKALVEGSVERASHSTGPAVHISLSARRAGQSLIVSVRDDSRSSRESVGPAGFEADVHQRLQTVHGLDGQLRIRRRPGGVSSLVRLPLRLQ